MLLECITAFEKAVLEVGVEKTNWSSTMPINNESIKWSASITFAGMGLEFGGHDSRAQVTQTCGTHRKSVGLGVAERRHVDKTLGLVTVRSRQLDRQTLWHAREEVRMLEMGRPTRKPVEL